MMNPLRPWALLVMLVATGCAVAPAPRDAPVAAPEPEPAVPESQLGEGLRPRTGVGRLAEAREALQARDYATAARVARAAYLLETELVAARVLEARALQEMGDLSGALEAWENLVRVGDAPPAALLAYVHLAERRGRLSEARAVVEGRVAAAPADPDLRGAAGWLAWRAGDALAARQHLESVAARLAPEYRVMLGRLRLLGGAPEAAAEAVAPLLEDGPGAAAAWVLLGDARSAQGLAAAAAAAYQRALEVRPDDYAAQVNLGTLRLKQDQLEAATALFRAAAEQRPGAPEAWNNLGLAQRLAGRLEPARQAYQRALEADPNYGPALKNLGILSEKYLRQPDAALSYYDRYLQAHPDDPEVVRWYKAAERAAADGAP